MVFDDGVVESDVIIVDDEASNVRLLEQALVQVGFVTIAGYTRTDDAWQRVLRKPPDLMLLDLHMPHIDGFEMLRMLADGGRTRTSWPILVLTADASPLSKFRALELGANDFLTKPFALQELFLRVNNLLAVHHLRGAIAAHTRQLEQRVAERTESLVMTVRALEVESKERRDAEHCLISQARQLKAANVKAIESERMKSELLATASHEMRTPLAVIREFSCLLLDGVASPAEGREFLSAIVRNCDRLGGLLDNLLEMHRIETGHMSARRRKTDIFDVLRRATTDLNAKGRSRNVSVMLDTRQHLPCVLADADKIEQVVVNLVGNAIKFTERGGVRVVVSVGQPVNSPNAAGEPRLVFEVIDTGIGMTADELLRLFQPFYQADSSTTRRFGGTGLGLTISRRLAHLLGGTIDVESEPDVGSVFRLTIAAPPASGARSIAVPGVLVEPRAAHTPPPTTARLDGRRLLLAEDGVDNQRLITRILEKAGASVTVVNDGRAALDAALESRAAGRPFDLVLMDMQMPVMDGYTAARQLREAGYTGVIVALTAHAMSGDRDRCLAAGCDEYATKPIDRAALINLLAQCCPAPASTP